MTKNLKTIILLKLKRLAIRILKSLHLKKRRAYKPRPPPIPNPEKNLVSIKRWSDNKQRYFYKPKDPEYARNHYWKHKRDLVCTCCGAIVQTAMFRHVKTLKCLNVKDRVQKALNERAEATQPAETQ